MRFIYTQTELTELFQKLGAKQPEQWAASQIEKGINQLGRFLFLRQAWRAVIDENDHSWIQDRIDSSGEYPDAPCSGIGSALERLLRQGVDPQDLTDIVRIMQYYLLFSICCLLSDPNVPEPELQDFSWRLFQLDQTGEIVAPIDGLQESLLETDPTGREMRQRQNSV